MGFLRRLLGGGREPAATGGDREPAATGGDREPAATGGDREPAATGGARDGAAVAPGEPPPADDEAARDRDLLRAEAERLDDDLLQRQLRYADRSWTPPRQGGEARAGEPGEGGDR